MDPWGEEELEPTFGELLQAQSGDLLLFAAYAAQMRAHNEGQMARLYLDDRAEYRRRFEAGRAYFLEGVAAGRNPG